MIDVDYLLNLIAEASEAILDVYATDFAVECKEDHSPVTLADRRSHEIINRGLRAAYPDIPVLSEEGSSIPHHLRRTWRRFWLVDPLDGTKEFVKKKRRICRQHRVGGGRYSHPGGHRHTHHGSDLCRPPG